MKYSRLKLVKDAIKNRGFIYKIPTLFRMLKSAKRGEYKMNKFNIIIAILTFIYVFSPLDFIPDWLPLLGIVDDISLLMIVFSKLMKEADKFLLWEQNQK